MVFCPILVTVDLEFPSMGRVGFYSVKGKIEIIKLISVFKRRPDLSVEAFQVYLLGLRTARFDLR